MFKRFVLRPVLSLLAVLGLAGAVLAAMIAQPLVPPPPLASIQAGAQKIDVKDAPGLSYLPARDGTQIGYRVFEPAGGGPAAPTAILIHGSAGHSINQVPLGRALAAAGVRAIAVDMRGHGASGARGDVAYIGQSEDDLADLMDHLKLAERPALVGFSMGGGFAARVAHTPLGARFSRFVLASPFLGTDAPTSRPSSGEARWANVDLPRIIALTILHRAGVDCCGALPVIAYGLPAEVRRYATTQYSFNLLSSFGPKDMRYRDLSGIAQPIAIISGEKDELMFAERYAEVAKTAEQAQVAVIPGVDHMGLAREPAALAAIVAAVKG